MIGQWRAIVKFSFYYLEIKTGNDSSYRAYSRKNNLLYAYWLATVQPYINILHHA